MLMRGLMMVAAVLALSAGGADSAWAQKTKTKGSAPIQQTITEPVSTLDPNAPDELKQIIDAADAAYFVDEGKTPDYEYAFKMYSLASEASDAYSINRMGLMYDRGEFVAQDFDKAFAAYKQAADLGLAAAMNNVANMYQAGDSVEQDYREALRWYQKAADGGYGYSMYVLGDMYLAGDGVAENHKEAVAWYQKAVDADEPNAFWALSLRYLYGDGVGKDELQAAQLAYKALTHGVQVALDEFKAIENADTTPSYRREVQQLLKRDGFYSGGIDGDFGASTTAALDAAFGSAL
ncbi:TPR repeat protein [Devosia sp. UYZn731]|uniref:SEL1-like repeat protein n=1 Tax=Devosia sp. UYZn731 TaxID=3156345 RepID=UPI003391A995